MTQDEPDTCRICSAPAEPDAPLFHPCKCSGTIRYIHQDCLTTWLAHSKKKTCDVCKYHYAFTKVYSENMPKQLPFVLFLRKFAQKAFWACVMGIRGLMVATIWLAFLPYVTVWTWRFYFIMGENIAWWIYDHPRPDSTPVFHSYFTNLTVADDQNRTTSDKNVLGLVTSYPVWRALYADIFTGQIIASLIILVFLGVFLLREWIIQNARPGVFGEMDAVDGEVLNGVDPVVRPDPMVVVPPGGPAQDHEAEQAVHGPAHDVVPTEQVPEENNPAAQETVEERPALNSRHKRRWSDMQDGEKREGNERDTSRFRTSMPQDDEPSLLEGHYNAEHSSNDSVFGDDVDETDVFGNEDNDLNGFESASALGDTTELPHRPPNPGLFSFGPSPDSADLFRYTPSTNLPFPLTPNSGAPVLAESSSSARRPPLPDINLSISESTNRLDEQRASQLAGPSFSTDHYESSEESLPSPRLATYQAPEELDVDAPSSEGSRTEFYDDDDDDDSHKSEKGSTSSSAVAAADKSAFHEELDEYFRDGAATDAREGPAPIRVEELLNAEDDIAQEPDLQVLEDEHDIVDADGADEQEGNIDDDVDGALEEAVGIRGPLTTVFQNAALMIFVLDTTIGLAVWLPFTIGKTVALLSLEPMRIVHVLQWPIRVIRYATDPVVDLLALVLFKTFRPTKRLSSTLLNNSPEDGYQNDLYDESRSARTIKTSLSLDFKVLFVGSDGQKAAILRGIEHVINSPVAQFLEPYFARLGKNVRVNAAAVKALWIELANGDASINRLFAIVLGYLLATLLLAVYLNVLNVGSVQSAGRAIRTAIRQQLIVLKVAIFIMVELAVFPLGCGIMLDFCTVQLFPDASVQSRLYFFAYAPITAGFYHWMVGTMFMYQFAILLGGCRKILRPGSLWFIKDPQDQNFHPIRDILERPTLIQVKKLAISAVMYSFVVAVGMGAMVTWLNLWGKLLLPLRWKLRDSLSDIPIDLLFLHIVMPSTLRYFRPRKMAFALARKYWKWAARQFRLTSYMFGGMHPEEMRPSRSLFSCWSSDFSSADKIQPDSSDEPFDGSYRRVPAQDNISLPREVRAMVEVDEHGNPLDEAGRRLMDLQDGEAEKAKRRVAADYTTVYLPPHFGMRMIFFTISLWATGSLLLVTAIAVPTLLGRVVFDFVLDREVHDGYSIVVGFYLLWGCYHIGKVLDRMDKRRQRSGDGRQRGSYTVYVFKRSMLWIGNVAWVGFWLGIVVPILLALVIEVYLVHPLRVMVNPDLPLEIRMIDSWAIGLVYTRMALSTMRLRPETRIDTALKEMRENGWRHLNAVPVTLDIIAPVTTGLISMLLLPILVVLGLQRVLPTKISSNTLFLYVYPGIFLCAVLIRAYTATQSICASWAQQIRDSEFLVEMRLRNLNSPAPSPHSAAALEVSLDLEHPPASAQQEAPRLE